LPGRFGDIATRGQRRSIVYQFSLGSDQLPRCANSMAPVSDVITPPSKLHTTSRRSTAQNSNSSVSHSGWPAAAASCAPILSSRRGRASPASGDCPDLTRNIRGVLKISPVTCNDTNLAERRTAACSVSVAARASRRYADLPRTFGRCPRATRPHCAT